MPAESKHKGQTEKNKTSNASLNFYSLVWNAYKDRGPIALLEAHARPDMRMAFSSRDRFFGQGHVAEGMAAIAFQLGKKLDAGDLDYRHASRELFFKALFDEKWNFKGTTVFEGMCVTDALFHVLPEVGAYMDVPAIYEWTKAHLTVIESMKSGAKPDALFHFCHIMAAIATYRVSHTTKCSPSEALPDMLKQACTISDVPAFLNYRLQYGYLEMYLKSLVCAIRTDELEKVRKTFPQPEQDDRGERLEKQVLLQNKR